MSEQILKIEADPRDNDCLQITLRHLPRKFNFWKPQNTQIAVYKGHGNNWYHIPTFRPAPNRLIPLLKAISYGPQYKHLRFKI